MSSQPQTSSEAIRIRELADGDRPVILHPEDDDLFMQTGRQVIEACRLNISLELWQHEVRSMLDHIQAWAAERPDTVRSCTVTPRHTKLLILVTPVGEQFDFDLADELAGLNRVLLRDYKVGMVEVLQVPQAELDRFVEAEETRQIHGRP